MTSSTMRQPNRWAIAMAAIAVGLVPSAVSAITAGTAGAAPSGPTLVPFSTVPRRCDQSAENFFTGRGTARGTATISSTSGQVVADIRFETGWPDTGYVVTLIQTPRPSSATCNGGEPGTVGGLLWTDGFGNGNLTLRAPIQSGATGAWVSILLPPQDPPPVQARLGSPKPDHGEIYTSDFIAPI